MNFNWFLNPITNHYADFEGRVGRREYWMFVLYWLLITVGLSLLGVIIGKKIAELIHTLLTLVILVPSVALAARRLHDTNKSGWWQIIALVPFLGWVILIFLLVQPSDSGDNKFGPVSSTKNDGANAAVSSSEIETKSESVGEATQENTETKS